MKVLEIRTNLAFPQPGNFSSINVGGISVSTKMKKRSTDQIC